jgi:hypothetical protein
MPSFSFDLKREGSSAPSKNSRYPFKTVIVI